MKATAIVFILIAAVAVAATALAGDEDKRPRSFFVTRSMAHENLMPFLKEGKPDVVQIGQYGPMFHGYADNPKSKGTPMQLPLTGEREVLKLQRELNKKIHELDLKVVGHFRLVKAYGNWKERTGFVDYYEKRWPEDLLGPKPHADLRELLQRDSSGEPIQISRYEQAQIAFCLSSPHAREMVKQMLKLAVGHGVDGVITTYNYHLECACPFCEKEFRDWLAEDEDRAQSVGIPDLKKYRFEEIPARISGYPDPAEASDLDWLAMRWAAENFKKHFDEIFIEYGRSLKPDLLVAQWNHMGHVGAGDERAFLPIEKWGAGEAYFWESGGASFVGKNLNLGERKAGDAWLSCLVLRELGNGKPFVMGKYDRMRMAVSMAEGYATGGLGMGRYMRFEDPAGYETLVRYLRFRHENEALFATQNSLATIGLVMPRQLAMAGDPKPLNHFRETGQALLEKQILFDVVADENITADRLERYRALILPEGTALSGEQNSAIKTFTKSGGEIIKPDRAAEFSRIQVNTAWTTRIAGYQEETGNRLIHLVNYVRDEGQTKAERRETPGNERPLAVHDIMVHIETEAGESVDRIVLHRPDQEEAAMELPFQQGKDAVSFVIPQILVYGVVEVHGTER